MRHPPLEMGAHTYLKCCHGEKEAIYFVTAPARRAKTAIRKLKRGRSQVHRI
jgi:hypothetical protein